MYPTCVSSKLCEFILFQMTNFHLFIFAIIFFRTTAKNFFITLDNSENEQDIEEEKAKKADEREVDMAKEVELKAATTDSVRDNQGSDYSDKSGKSKCRYKKNKR